MLTKNGVLVLQGDSITDAGRFGEPENLGSGYARMVAKYIENFYPDLEMKVYNRGISGHRSKDLVERWDKDCLDLNPTVVTLLIGINDVWRSFDQNDPTSVEAYAENCEKLMKQVKDAGASLIVLEPFAIPPALLPMLGDSISTRRSMLSVNSLLNTLTHIFLSTVSSMASPLRLLPRSGQATAFIPLPQATESLLKKLLKFLRANCFNAHV